MLEAVTMVDRAITPAEQSGLTGSWAITIFETDGPPSRGLLTIHADGTLVSAEHPVVTPPGAPGVIFTSSGHGSWMPKGHGEADFASMAFGSDAIGQLFAVVTFAGSVSIDPGGELVGSLTARIEDPTGNHLASYPLTLRGTRIVATAATPGHATYQRG